MVAPIDLVVGAVEICDEIRVESAFELHLDGFAEHVTDGRIVQSLRLVLGAESPEYRFGGY